MGSIKYSHKRISLDIVIRIHDGQNIHGGPNKKRYIDVSKKTLIIGCLSSLINSTNKLKNDDVKISFSILNDNCTNECVNEIQRIFSFSRHDWKLINLKIRGFHHSALKQFELCKNSNANLVYSVEDDYLHCETSIYEMIQAFYQTKKYYNGEKEVCVYPFDNPEDYLPERIYSGKVFRFAKRHWKEGIWTTFTMMTSPKVFKDHWKTFEKLATKYTPWNGIDPIDELVHEGNTICNIWQNQVIRINPIPSVALHVQFENQKDLFLDEKKWWIKYSLIKKTLHNNNINKVYNNS